MSTVEVHVTSQGPWEDDPQQKRRAPRLKCDRKGVLLRDPLRGPQEGATVDESFGGIGIVVDDAPTVQIGQDVDVLYNGVRMTASVCHLTANDDDTFQIGLEWKSARMTQRARDAVNRRRQALTDVENQSPEQLAFEKFVRMIPGGVYMMWSLYESANYYELGEAAQRLLRQASTLGLDRLEKAVSELQASIDTEESPEVVGEALQTLVGQCIALCELPETAEV